MTTFIKKLLGSSATRERGAIGGIPEQVIAIAVGVIVVSGMVALGSRAFTSSRVNTEIANIQQIVNGTKSLYSGMSEYTGLTIEVLVKGGVLPASMNVGGTAAKNAWGGALTVTVQPAGFSIKSVGYPQDACVDIATKTPSSGYSQIIINATTITSFPVTPAAATTACVANSSIEWFVQ